MKIKHLIAVLIFMLPVLAGFAGNGGYATMRVFDCNRSVSLGGGYMNSKIIIVYEDGNSEEIDLLPFSEKNEVENLKKVNATLNKLKGMGYFLISQTTTGEQGSIMADYTLLKQ